MPMTIIFWGHGDWRAGDGKTFVPPGCRLYLFQRHKEAIDTQRMDDIKHRVIRSKELGENDWVASPYFGDDLRTNGDLRRIKTGLEQVHNYRLYPPSDGVYWPDPVPPEIAATCRVVTTDKAEGETLRDLFLANAAGPAHFLWIPCRAVRDATDNLIDGGNYHRPAQGYFRP